VTVWLAAHSGGERHGPAVLHFRAAYDGRPDGWLEPMLQFVAWENQAQAPGADAILARLGDVIVIQAIRAHLAS